MTYTFRGIQWTELKIGDTLVKGLRILAMYEAKNGKMLQFLDILACNSAN